VNSALNKPLTFNGGTGNDALNVNAGAFTFAADANVGSANLAVNVAAGASVSFNVTQHLDSLNVAGTATAQAGGNIVPRDQSARAGRHARSERQRSRARLHRPDAGRRGADADQHRRNGGTWTGLGLTSSIAKNANPQNTTLAVLESSEFQSLYPGAPFSGEPIDASAVLVKFTYYGDTTSTTS